jgi:hypothetical protein
VHASKTVRPANPKRGLKAVAGGAFVAVVVALRVAPAVPVVLAVAVTVVVVLAVPVGLAVVVPVAIAVPVLVAVGAAPAGARTNRVMDCGG